MGRQGYFIASSILLLLRNTRKTGRVRASTRIMSFFAAWRRAAAPFALLLSLAGGSPAQTIPPSNAPNFTAAGVVQAATQTAETLAPNTITTIYGSNLSWTTHAVTAADLNEGTLPTSLDGVIVYVNHIESNLLYVSPGQINFLIPYEIVGSSIAIEVARQGVAGPVVVVPLATVAPGLFQWNGTFAVAQHADYTLITPDAPARPNEIIVLYAAGLGRTVPDSSSGATPHGAMPILYDSQLEILLNGTQLPKQNILYAGVTPGCAG